MSSFRESIDFIESSFTLQAYANTLAEVLEEFTMKILLLERKLNEHGTFQFSFHYFTPSSNEVVIDDLKN